eukprot:g1413.t1
MDGDGELGQDLIENASPGMKSFLLGLLSYSSIKYVHVDARTSFWPVVTFRVLQVVILLYVVLFTVVDQKAYNEYDTVVAESFFKMKGAAQAMHTYPNGTKASYIVDVNDLLQPPLMENALFITTGMVTNKEVRNTTCADTGGLVDNEPYALCANPLPAWKDVKIHNCTEKKGTYVHFKNDGMYTGNCVLPKGETDESKPKYCEVRGWCAEGNTFPHDPDAGNYDVVIDGVEDWSLYIRLNAEFPQFEKKMNTAPDGKIVHLKNQWYISEILEGAGTNIDEVSERGAIVLMKATFDCDFNTQSETNCDPTWTYSRLDKTYEGQPLSSIGFNYYQAVSTGDDTRTLNKRYGLKIEIHVDGQGGRFSIVALSIALGSGIGLLSVASLVTDFLLQNVCKSEKYMERKFDDLIPDNDRVRSTRNGDYKAPRDEDDFAIRSNVSQESGAF